MDNQTVLPTVYHKILTYGSDTWFKKTWDQMSDPYQLSQYTKSAHCLPVSKPMLSQVFT